MKPTQRTRLGRHSAVALLVAGTSIMALSQVAWASNPTDSPGKGESSAKGNPYGNNGTIKIDGVPLQDSNRNEPHVGCRFNLEFSGYDQGDINASVRFELQPPTLRDSGSQVLLEDTVPIGGDPAGGAGDLDASRRYTLNFTGVEAQPKQGYHVKVTIDAPGSRGADVKHKVFWVTACTPETPPTTQPRETTTTTVHPTTTTTAAPTTTTTTAAAPTTTTTAAPQVLGVQTTATTAPPQVLGETETRPVTLPRTGRGSARLTFFAGLAMALGGALRLLSGARRPARQRG